MLHTDKNNRPETTEYMKSVGQVWVWMNGANPPQWQIRGTGVMRTSNGD